MAEKTPVLADIDYTKKAIEDVFYNKDYAQISGPVDKVLNTLIAMRETEGPHEEKPGWTDNLSRAIAEEDNVIYRMNRVDRLAYGRWYEIGEDGSVFSILANYVKPLIDLGGSFYHAYKSLPEIDLEERFKEIRKRAELEAAIKMKAEEMERGREEGVYVSREETERNLDEMLEEMRTPPENYESRGEVPEETETPSYII